MNTTILLLITVLILACVIIYYSNRLEIEKRKARLENIKEELKEFDKQIADNLEKHRKKMEAYKARKEYFDEKVKEYYSNKPDTSDN